MVKYCTEKDCNRIQQVYKGGIEGKCEKHGGKPICTEKNCTSRQCFLQDSIPGKCQRHGRKKCSLKDCKSIVQYYEGGIRDRCAKHGGRPKCEKKNCKNLQSYKKGGKRGYCQIHGGFPKCTEKGCNDIQKFRKGGIKGKCHLHGGMPKCTEKGCDTPQQLRTGGIKGKCQKHGGVPQCEVEGCTTPQLHKTGGKKGRCTKHGGIPQCTEDGCETPQQYGEGGIKGKCKKHGGHPTCELCDKFVNFKEGGIRGRCIEHGGYPICEIKNCDTPQSYKTGGIKGRCRKHGGAKKIECTYADHSLKKYKKGEYMLKCTSSFYSNMDLQRHIKSFHTKKGIQKKKRMEQVWLKYLTSNGYMVDNDHEATVTHCGGKDIGVYRSRIDFFLPLVSDKYLTFVEIDEHHHSDRPASCEFARMANVLRSLQKDETYKNKSILFIRVNPHDYKINKVKGKTLASERKQKLLEVLDTDWSSKLKPGLTINLIYMYYPVNKNNLPLLFDTNSVYYTGSEQDAIEADRFRDSIIEVIV